MPLSGFDTTKVGPKKVLWCGRSSQTYLREGRMTPSPLAQTRAVEHCACEPVTYAAKAVTHSRLTNAFHCVRTL